MAKKERLAFARELIAMLTICLTRVVTIFSIAKVDNVVQTSQKPMATIKEFDNPDSSCLKGWKKYPA
jgi:hypothetical protein